MFDYEKFYSWCERLSERGAYVFISEYEMPSDRFECVLSLKKQSTYGPNRQVTERLYVPRGQRRAHAVQLSLFG